MFQLNRTRQLMTMLLSQTVTAVGPLAAELKKFFWLLYLDPVTYSPMGIFTLTRPVCASVMIRLCSHYASSERLSVRHLIFSTHCPQFAALNNSQPLTVRTKRWEPLSHTHLFRSQIATF